MRNLLKHHNYIAGRPMKTDWRRSFMSSSILTRGDKILYLRDLRPRKHIGGDVSGGVLLFKS